MSNMLFFLTKPGDKVGLEIDQDDQVEDEDIFHWHPDETRS